MIFMFFSAIAYWDLDWKNQKIIFRMKFWIFEIRR